MGEERFSAAGCLLAMSHVMYLTGLKCFALDVSGRWLVLVPIAKRSFRFLQTRGETFVGARVDVDQLIKLTGQQVDKYGRLVCQVTSESRIQISSADDDQSEKVEIFAGVVTEDADARSGVVTLNKCVTLVATGLGHVTNVRRLRRGQRVLVANAHLIRRYGERPILAACARSYVRVEGQMLDSIHCKDTSSEFGKDTIVHLTVSRSLSPATVLALVDLRRRLSIDDALREQLATTDEKGNGLESICSALGAESALDASGQHWTLLDEFCHVDHVCPATSVESRRLLSFPSSLEDQKRNLLREMRSLRTELRTSGRGGQRLTWCQRQYRKQALLGKINMSHNEYALADSSGEIPLCLTEALEAVLINCGLLLVRNFMCFLEWTDDWERLYVVPTLAEPALEAMPPRVAEGKLYRVLDVSPLDELSFNVTLRSDGSSGRRGRSTSKRKAPPLCLQLDRRKDMLGYRRLANGWRLRLAEGEKSRVTEIYPSREPSTAAYSLDQLVDFAADEKVTVQAIVIERWLEADKYEPTLDVRANIGRVPNGQVCHVKLTSDDQHGEGQQRQKVSLYFSGGRILPMALVPGARLKVESARKVVSRRGHAYLSATYSTLVTILTADFLEGRGEEEQESKKINLLEEIGR